jgi:uncharacterized protein (DUF1800 family)
VDVYQGDFGVAQAERLLWRAGFGARGGEAESVAAQGLEAAVNSLVNPDAEQLVGPPPHAENGRALEPEVVWGDDHCWWLDRMVRSSTPLVERMTLIWHSWFATSNAGVGSQRLMLNQNGLFRQHALGAFDELMTDVTVDPAMLLWLDGAESVKQAANENYGREMMECFSLGAGRGAYTELDVRQQARSLTGWENGWNAKLGPVDFHFNPAEHDDGIKTVFGHSGNFNWMNSVALCVAHPLHPSFFVTKLWGYFVPTPPSSATLAALEALYVPGYQVKPVVQAILQHPDFYLGPRMVTPPVVYTAGLLRRLGAGITTNAWAWIGQLSGQQLFYPPNVAGWDYSRWLNTATFLGRWIAASQVLQGRELNPSHPAPDTPSAPAALVERALQFWHNPDLSEPTQTLLTDFAERALADANASWEKQTYPVLVENALRQLIAVSPDLQTA